MSKSRVEGASPVKAADNEKVAAINRRQQPSKLGAAGIGAADLLPQYLIAATRLQRLRLGIEGWPSVDTRASPKTVMTEVYQMDIFMQITFALSNYLTSNGKIDFAKVLSSGLP